MATYTVTRLIKSAAHLWEPYQIDGIMLRSIDTPPSDDLLVWESLDAANYRDASRMFDQHLLTVIDAVSIVTGAALRPLGGSTLIEKKRGKYVYLQAVRRRPAAPLSVFPGFNTHLLDDAAKVARRFQRDRHRRFASHYLRQAALSENLVTSTFHLLQAVEVLATQPGRTRTDHTVARNLIGGSLYDYFYRVDPVLGESRRNAFAHGRLMDEEDLAQQNRALFSHLLSLLRNHFRVSAHSSFSPVRGFITYEPIGLFLEPHGLLPSLRDLVTLAIDGMLHSGSNPRWVGGMISKRLLRVW